MPPAPRSPLQLAALASAAVPGLDPVAAAPGTTTGAEYDVAVVEDTRRRRWVVRSPRRTAAGARLETEMRLLRALAQGASLPFAVPEPAGTVVLPEGGRCVVHPHLRGRPLQPGELQPGPGLGAGLGRALAALHDVPPSVLDDVDLPTYDAAAYRERRLSEVDRAAATGHVPAGLLGRWERALEDVGRWRFQPTLVHGDLVAEHVLVDDDEITGVLDWGDAVVADPADDLAWVAVGADTGALDSVLEAYAVARREQPDRDIAVRARLAGELALVRWLLHGVHADDTGVVDDAVGMLVELDDDVGQERL